MRAVVFVALVGVIVILGFLTSEQWIKGNYGLVAFGVILILICSTAFPDLVKREKQPTAEQLRDSDELYNEAAIQFIETQMERKTKFWVAVVLGILLIASFVICVMWAGFKA